MADNHTESEGRVRSYLANHGGSVEDAGGRGLTDEMARAIGVDKPAALSAILGRMESDGVITRDMRGLRTYRISLATSDEPALVAAEPGPGLADNGGSSRTGRHAGRSVGLRDARPEELVPTDLPDAPRAGAMSLREALSRRPAAPEVAAAAAVAAPAAVEPDPAAEPTEQSPAKAVSLRDAIKRKAAAGSDPAPVPAPAAVSAAPAQRAAPARRDFPSAEPATSQRPAARSMSLRDALAAESDTDAPAWAREPTSQFSAAPTAAGPDYRTTTSTRLREPAAPPWVDDDPGTKTKKRKAGKADRPKRADKSAQKAAQKAERRRRLQDQLSISVPKAPPSATIVTAVGVAVAGLVLVAVISVVVSRGSTHHVPTNDTVSSSTDACAVVDTALASAAFGQPAGPPNFVLDSCVYDDGTHELIVVVYRSNARALFDAGRSSQALDVPGIGDGAYYVDGRLRVLKGNSLLLVTLGPIPASTPNPKLVALAGTAAGRL
ncbi:MAG: hypothetical protein QOG44_3192 [Acidimicrobiaceae bacterium]|jgi:hypothetical protein|nr:hypothetical protein [Acidimicrobiaceae bacterium]